MGIRMRITIRCLTLGIINCGMQRHCSAGLLTMECNVIVLVDVVATPLGLLDDVFCADG